MKNRSFIAGVTAGLFMLMAQGSAVQAAEVKVLSANALRRAINELGPQFERATGHKLVIQFHQIGPLKRKIDTGETFDVAILTTPMFSDLVKTGKIVAGTRADIARTGLGVVVRAGTPKPSIGSSDAFKRALLNAKSITYNPEGASGAHFIKILARLGITEQMKPKTKLVREPGAVAKSVAAGDAELGVEVMSGLQSVPGTEILGPLPAELQEFIVYTAAIGAASQQGEAGKAFISFLKAPAAAPVFKAKGLEPVAR